MSTEKKSEWRQQGIQQGRGLYRMYEAATENLRQAVVLWKAASSQRGKVERGAMWKASVILAVSAADAELTEAIAARKMRQHSTEAGVPVEHKVMDIRKSVYEELSKLKFKKFVKKHLATVEQNGVLDFGKEPLQTFNNKVREYRNAVVHTRLDKLGDLGKYNGTKGSAEAIRNCLEVMILLSSAFDHQKPSIIEWWRSICTPLVQPDH